MAPLHGTVCVIGSQYIDPNPMDLIFIREGLSLDCGSLLITDVNHKTMFMVKNCETNFHERRLLVDANNMEHPIATLQNKIMTVHGRWKVFRGDSTDNSKLLCTVRNPHILQFQTELNVYLSGNNEEASCDFRLEGSWSDRNCKIYLRNSSTIIAQMHRTHPTENEELGEDKFMVTISPKVDYAFIVAIFSILSTLKSSNKDDESNSGFVSTAISIATSAINDQFISKLQLS